MTVREIRNQEAEHDSGVVLRSRGRDSLGLDYRGRSLELPVESAPGYLEVYLAAVLR